MGNCGKSATVSREQDLLMHSLKGISQYTARAAKLGKTDDEIDRFQLDAAFATLTNVNFDQERFVGFLKEADSTIRKAEKLYAAACLARGVKPEKVEGPATWRLQHSDLDGPDATARRLDSFATLLNPSQCTCPCSQVNA